MHFPTNFGADDSEIRFIGFKGEFTERRREAVNAGTLDLLVEVVVHFSHHICMYFSYSAQNISIGYIQ